LKKWVTESSYDFDTELYERFSFFVNRVIAKYENKLYSTLSQAMSKGRRTTTILPTFPSPAPLTLMPKTPSLTFVDIHPMEIARQLTLMDYMLCREIQPKECLGCAWMKHDKEKNSPNLLAMIKRFNKVSKWVAATLVKETVIRKRVRILSHILSVVQHLRELNNFNALFQIIGGLGNSSVHRITKTFQQIDSRQKKVLDDMRFLTNPLKSWANYRKTIHEVDPPCVPFIGVYQTDLTFIEDGNPTKFANGFVNFKKCRLVAGVIMEIQVYQMKPYNLTSVPQLQEFLDKSIEEVQTLDDKGLYELSLLAEPRAKS